MLVSCGIWCLADVSPSSEQIKRSDHKVEQLIDLEEKSCLLDVSNKYYYLRKKR